MTDFPVCNSNKPIPMSLACTTSPYVQIVQLWGFSPYPSASSPSIYLLLLQRRKDFFGLWILILILDSNLIYSLYYCNSCNLRIKGFHINPVSLFLCYFYLRALLHFISYLWWWSTVESLVTKNHHHSVQGKLKHRTIYYGTLQWLPSCGDVHRIRFKLLFGLIK